MSESEEHEHSLTGIPPPVDWMHYLCISPISGSVVIILSSLARLCLSTLLVTTQGEQSSCPGPSEAATVLLRIPPITCVVKLSPTAVSACIQVQILTSFSVESSFNNRNRGKCRNNRTGIKPDSCNAPAPVKDIFGPTHLLTNAVMQFVHSIE